MTKSWNLDKIKEIVHKDRFKMTMEEWEEITFNKDILRYKAQIFQIREFSINRYSMKISELFPTFSHFKRHLYTYFIPKYINYAEDFFKTIYEKSFDKYVRPSYVKRDLYLDIVNIGADPTKNYFRAVNGPIKYIRKGMTVEEAIKRWSFHCKSISPFTKEHYLEKGYDINESQRKAAEFQKKHLTSLTADTYYERFNDEELRKYFEEQTKDFPPEYFEYKRKERGFRTETREDLIKFLKSFHGAKNSNYGIERFLSEGDDFKTAYQKMEEAIWEINPMNIEFWLKKGYTEEEAREKMSEHSYKNGSNSASSYGGKHAKMAFEYISDKVKDHCEEIQYGYLNGEKILNVPANHPLFVYRKTIRLDLYLVTKKGKQIDIEYDDWYIHKDKVHIDNLREEFLKSLGFLVIRISSLAFGKKRLDYDFLDDIITVIKEN